MNNYNDIILLPHKVSLRHKAMSLHDRAAQFAPFAALTGFDALIAESERYTDCRPVLCEDDANMLNTQFLRLYDSLDKRPAVSMTYFVKDKYKSGGSFVTKNGVVRLMDTVNRRFIFFDKTVIPFDDVVSLDLAEN